MINKILVQMLSHKKMRVIKKIKIVFLKLIKHPIQGAYYRRKAGLSNNDTIPSNKYFLLGLVAILRGEDDYLIEWIEFHILLGVNHFVLYDNGTSLNTFNLLKKYIDQGLVTYFSFPHIDGLRDGRYVSTLTLQQLAYADCIIRFSKHFKYLLQLDIDEFLFPKNYNSITEVLNLFNDKVSRIDINLINFGSAGHVNKPNGLVINNFTKSCKSIAPTEVKCIVNTKYLSKFFKYSNVHKFSIWYPVKDIINKIRFGYPKVLKGNRANKLFQLNHYITKSKEEFIKKGIIYQDGWQVRKKTQERFDMLNKKYNQVTNDNIRRFIPKLQIEEL